MKGNDQEPTISAAERRNAIRSVSKYKEDRSRKKCRTVLFAFVFFTLFLFRFSFLILKNKRKPFSFTNHFFLFLSFISLTSHFLVFYSEFYVWESTDMLSVLTISFSAFLCFFPPLPSSTPHNSPSFSYSYNLFAVIHHFLMFILSVFSFFFLLFLFFIVFIHRFLLSLFLLSLFLLPLFLLPLFLLSITFSPISYSFFQRWWLRLSTISCLL